MDDLLDDIDRPLERQRATAGDQLVNVSSFDKFQRDKEMPVGIARIVDGDDVFVLKLSGRLGFCLKATNKRFVFPRAFSVRP